MKIFSRFPWTVFLVLILWLPGCFPGGFSYDRLSLQEARPDLPTSWRYIRVTRSADAAFKMRDFEPLFAVSSLRRAGRGYEIIAGKAKDPAPLSFEKSPKAPGVLAAVVENEGKKDKQTGKRETFYMISFIAPLRGDKYRLLILNKTSLELWRPADAEAVTARNHLLRLEFDGDAAPIFRSKRDLEQALIAASYLPAKHSIEFTLTAIAPKSNDKEKTPTTPRPSNKSWFFNASTDPITKKSKNNIVIRAKSVEPRANLAINFFCDKRQLRAVLHNPDISFRNDTSNAKVALSLVEMRVDDKTVHNMVWERAAGYRDHLVDLGGAGGLYKFATLLNPRMQNANHDWSSVWFLNKVANAREILMRVTDSGGTAYVARFEPYQRVGPVIDFLPACLKRQ
ncbi:hypothetical protein ACM25N_12910 [Roseovarius sp. C7]|uniref:hypothetical protein n=1 Tax=Roseovarius sp. C7 TaxID=3398643 RepID=UPI0039F68397